MQSCSVPTAYFQYPLLSYTGPRMQTLRRIG